MSIVNIVLKSGKILEMECDSFSVSRNKNTNQIVGIDWINCTPKVLYLDLADISSIVEVTGDKRKAPVK